MLTVSDHSPSLGKAPQVAADKYDPDGIADDALFEDLSPHMRSGYTRDDQKDMHRMGKNQELMVSKDDSSWRISDSSSVANVSIFVDGQFHHVDSGYVGVRHHVSRSIA